MFFQFPLCWVLEWYIFDLYTKIWIRRFGLYLFFSSQRELHSVRNIDFFCQILTYLVSIGVIKDRSTKMYPKYFNGKLWTNHLSCVLNSLLYDPATKYWLFEKFIFELEASYSFKITCILVRQVICLTKSGGVIRKIYCLI